MNQQAKVNSIVALKELRSALAKFAESAAAALDEVSSEIQRTQTWLTEDRRRYWKNEVRLRQERYVQAKLALKRKGIFDIALAGLRSSAIDEKKALAIAERHLREAERRQARTRSWILQIEKELSDYRAATQGLSGAVDMAIPNARARLEKMIESLEAYVALAAPEMARDANEEAAANAVESRAGSATVFRSPPGEPGVQSSILELRKLTPSPEARRATAPGSVMTGWIAAIGLREAPQYAGETMEVAPDDKIVLAQPQDEPGLVYLERTQGEAGDSGWYVGVDRQTQSDGYGAVRVGDLLQECPGIERILCLPTGSLLLFDLQNGTEALFDASDNLLWSDTAGKGAGPEAETSDET